MEITWLGHSSFLLKDSKGRTIITDPFDTTVGYKTFSGNVDIVTISHHHFDHDYTKNLTCSNIIDKTGFFNICDIPITGIPSFHDKEKGAKRGENTIYIFELDGYRICHLGDLGYILSNEETKILGKIHVLLIPIGGNYTISGKEASEISKAINPNIIIPMHYMTQNLSFELEGLENFLIHMKQAENTNDDTLSIEGELIGNNKVKILNLK